MCMSLQSNVCACVLMSAWYVCEHVCMYVSAFSHLCLSTCVCTNACVFVFKCVCVCVSEHVSAFTY